MGERTGVIMSNQCKHCGGHPVFPCVCSEQVGHGDYRDLRTKGCYLRQLAQLARVATDLCDHLDEVWYEGDPMSDVKLGDQHPWTAEIREVLGRISKEQS